MSSGAAARIPSAKLCVRMPTSTSTKRVAKRRVAGRHRSECVEQRFGHDAMPADRNEHRQRQESKTAARTPTHLLRSPGLNTSASDRPLIWLTICPATWMPENRMLTPSPSSSPTSASFASSRPYSTVSVDRRQRRVQINAASPAATSPRPAAPARAAAAPASRRSAPSSTSAPVRASTSVNTMNRLTRNVSRPGIV